MGYECEQMEKERRREELGAFWDVPWQPRPIAAYLGHGPRQV